MSDETPHQVSRFASRGRGFCVASMILTALAAGLGWGIRGQYGHESGAMIAGVLAALTLVLFYAEGASTLAVARAAALASVMVGVGGSMTYAQSIGLTHEKQLVGNWEAWRWGMLGLFIKGGIWIGYFGAFLGMGLSGKRYKPLELVLMLGAMLGLVFLGTWWINSPFDPANKVLPRVYFSFSWYFEPNRTDLKPRPENWGGLIVALAAAVAYAGVVKRDKLAVKLALWAFVGGGLGQSLGQCIQSYHAWNLEFFQTGWPSKYTVLRVLNWWNTMETTFGLIFGAVIALGLYRNRHLVAIDQATDEVTLSPTVEVNLVIIHLFFLLTSEFIKVPRLDGQGSIPFDIYVDYGLIMCFIPLFGISGGRLWPTFQLLIVVASTILGKEIRDLCYNGLANDPKFSPAVGWFLFAMIPSALLLVLTSLLVSYQERLRPRVYLAIALLTNVWLYFGLNTFFFNYAWPWAPLNEWTYRTPNQLVFILCTVALTVLSFLALLPQKAQPQLQPTPLESSS